MTIYEILFKVAGPIAGGIALLLLLAALWRGAYKEARQSGAIGSRDE